MSHIHFDNINDYCAALGKPAPVHLFLRNTSPVHKAVHLKGFTNLQRMWQKCWLILLRKKSHLSARKLLLGRVSLYL